MERQLQCGTAAPRHTYKQCIALCLHIFIPVFLSDIFNRYWLWAFCINWRHAVRGLCIDFFVVSEFINQLWMTESRYWSCSNVFSIRLITLTRQQEEQLQQVGCFMFYWSHLCGIYLLQEKDMTTVITPGGQKVNQRVFSQYWQIYHILLLLCYTVWSVPPEQL